jgi:hypothetical protein
MRHSFSSIEKESVAQDKSWRIPGIAGRKKPAWAGRFLHRGAVPSAEVSVDGTWRDARQNEKSGAGGRLQPCVAIDERLRPIDALPKHDRRIRPCTTTRR